MNNFEAHILVVDDDDGIRNLVKQYLLENNFLITTAKNAEEAKNKIAVVTGAGKGLGRACAIALAEDGANLVIIIYYSKLI